MEAIQNRSHEPMYKTNTKIKAKRLRVIAIAKLEERKLYWEKTPKLV